MSALRSVTDQASDVRFPIPSGGFVAFDEFLLHRAAQTSGVCFLIAENPALQLAITAHVQRRISNERRRVVAISSAKRGHLWREISLRLGLMEFPSDADAAANLLFQTLANTQVVILCPLVEEASFDDVVTKKLLLALSKAKEPQGVLVLLARTAQVNAWEPSDICRFVIEEQLSDEAIQRWWSVIATQMSMVSACRHLAQLEPWWAMASNALWSTSPVAALSSTRSIPMSADVQSLLRRLKLVGRPWPVHQVGYLATASMETALLSGVLLLQDGMLTVRDSSHEHASWFDVRLDDDVVAAAGALSKVFPFDGWALSHAACLWASVRDVTRAEESVFKALSLADELLVRSDIWSEWALAVETLSPSAQVNVRLRAAEQALHLGDVDEALRWAERVVQDVPNDANALLALGRAWLGRGDLAAARATFERARLYADEKQSHSITAELGEVRYAEGEHELARLLATEVCQHVSVGCARLQARNTLGKILLAEGRWQDAENHFAGDESEAGCLGDRLAQLRARVNRAIALVSAGRHEEAQPMLEAVLHEGMRLSNQRAIAFALTNLAVLATHREDFAEALSLSERAIVAYRKLGERLGLARVITNLAELRVRLGLLDEAEQALAFGRQVVCRGIPIPRGVHFSLVSARIALARGDSVASLRDINTALGGATSSSDGDALSECHRLAVRVALEDGDTTRAARFLDLASGHASAPAAHAEVELLRAMLLRAEGHCALEQVACAVTLAQRAADQELLREAHSLAGLIASQKGELSLARSHLAQAISLRERVMRSMAPHLRASYLSRRDLMLLSSLEQTLEHSLQPAVEIEPPSRAITQPTATRLMIGEHASLRTLHAAIRKVARVDTTVLIHGESGTGKELVAESLHAQSPRHVGPLVKVNCAALVDSLLLSELFGHEKGAFTGATSRKRGRFESAEGGTLFLDEIGDISPQTQVALLRVLQERTFERVGGTTSIRCDVRVICATHRDLRAMVERGEFRQDLYFRLTGVVLEVPSLRSRINDLPLLAAHMLERIAAERGEIAKTLSSDALQLLRKHAWPGNIRELENVLRAVTVFVEGDTIFASDLTMHVETFRTMAVVFSSSNASNMSNAGNASPVSSSPSSTASPPLTSTPQSVRSSDDVDSSEDSGPLPDDESAALDVVFAQLKAGRLGLFDAKRQLERDCIAKALQETHGNITRAASLLGMKRPRLSQLVKQYGLAAASSENS